MEIELPDGTVLEAPDNADPSAVAKAYLAKQRPEPSLGAKFGSAFVRPIAKAVAGIPMMAADAGVGTVNGIRDLIEKRRLPMLNDFNPFAMTSGTEGGGMELPSAMFNRSLDSVTTAPSGIAGKGAEFISTALLGSRIPAAPTIIEQPPANFISPKLMLKNQALAAAQKESNNPAAMNRMLEGIAGKAKQSPTNFISPKLMLKNQALAAAQKEGYVVPPSSNNPTAMNRMLEGIAGKAKLSQEAMMRNQGVTDTLAPRALGQNPDVPLTPEGLAVIREEAHSAGYVPVKQAGQMTTDSAYVDALNKITQSGEGATRMGVKAPSPADDVIKTLADKKTFDAGDGIDTIAYLRTLADDAYSAGQKSVGKAYKSAAKALEDVIERNLEAKGKDGAGLLKGYRDARQLIAQTYTAGKALTDTAGTSNALSYANAVRKGLPLVGDQRTMGQFAAQFGKFAGVPKEIYPSISPLDVYGSAISAGVTGSAAPLMVPLSRVALREYLLSQAGQARAIPQAFKPQTTLGLFGATVPTGLMAGP